MGVPKKHTTKGSRNQRRMHLGLSKTQFGVCPKCGKAILGHTVCPNCGFYKSIERVNVLAKLEKKERKRREVCPNCGFYKSIERVNVLAKLEKKERKRRKKEIKETEKDIEKGKKGEKPLTMEELSRKKF